MEGIKKSRMVKFILDKSYSYLNVYLDKIILMFLEEVR